MTRPEASLPRADYVLSRRTRGIEVRLLCAYDDDLHAGLVHLVAGLRRHGHEPEVVATGVSSALLETHCDLLVVCRGPESNDECPEVREAVARVEASGGGVITVVLTDDVVATVARVHRCATLRLAISGAREVRVSAARAETPRGRIGTVEKSAAAGAIEVLEPDAEQTSGRWRPRHVAWIRAQPSGLTPFSSKPTPPRATPRRAAVGRPSWLTVCAVATVWLLVAGLVVASDASNRPVAESRSITLSEEGATPRDNAELRPAPRSSSRPSESTMSATEDERPWLFEQSRTLAIVDREEIADTQPERTSAAVTATAVPRSSRRVRMVDLATPAGAVDPESGVPVAESARCRETRRSTTEARQAKRWADARALLADRECWPSADVRASLLSEVRSGAEE